jgi:hypothetical protein
MGCETGDALQIDALRVDREIADLHIREHLLAQRCHREKAPFVEIRMWFLDTLILPPKGAFPNVNRIFRPYRAAVSFNQRIMTSESSFREAGHNAIISRPFLFSLSPRSAIGGTPQRLGD